MLSTIRSEGRHRDLPSRLLEAPMVKTSWFDVFDTSLTRSVGSPAAVFLLLGKRVSALSLVSLTPEAFARARIAAEQQSYKNLGVAKTTLASIYTELGAALRLTEEQSRRIMRAECDLEAELLRKVPPIQSRIEAARAREGKVTFVSDMYLPREFIQQQLSCHGSFRNGDVCCVSSD